MKIFRITAMAASMLVLANTASADVYQIYLYYDGGQLFFDRDHDLKVIRSEGSENNPVGDFRVEVVDKSNKVLHSTKFDPRPEVYVDHAPPNTSSGGLMVLDRGVTAIRLSYFSTGMRLKIYNPANVLVLEHDISYLANLASVSPSPTSNVQASQANAQNTRISWYWWALAIFVLGITVILSWRFLKRRHAMSILLF